MKPAWEQAARTGDVEALRSQLAMGADVDSLDRYGQSALMLAAVAGHLEAVKLLAESGADLDVAAKHGLSATMLAVVNGHQAVALLLARAGADLTLAGTGAPGFAGRTAADLAREQGLTDLAGQLAP